MKLYIVSNSETGKENIDGIYNLVSEDGEGHYSHWCSNKTFAHDDLIGRRKERQIELKSKYGEYEILNLGDDEMTIEKLIKLNKEFRSNRKEEI